MTSCSIFVNDELDKQVGRKTKVILRIISTFNGLVLK